ncbi:MAG: hypothetical protein QXH45_06895 [Thermosphaera sp.]
MRLTRESESVKSKKNILHGVLGGTFLIGLAMLFYFDEFRPWILAVIGILAIGEAVITYYSQ